FCFSFFQFLFQQSTQEQRELSRTVYTCPRFIYIYIYIFIPYIRITQFRENPDRRRWMTTCAVTLTSGKILVVCYQSTTQCLRGCVSPMHTFLCAHTGNNKTL
ncbi:unnamed protein product, partial [Ixodes persulcatus]